ncbi:MAG: hypothetical protein J5626_01145 [Lachnospiraceae bacterium]|nr:hypothetical protein [Lachnospiraceae bacterium]
MNNTSGSFLKQYKIAGITLSVETDFAFDYDKLSLFEIKEDAPVELTIRAGHCSTADAPVTFGQPIISSEYMDVYEVGNTFRFLYNSSPDIHSCEYDTLSHEADIVILYGPKPGVESPDFTFEDHFFFAIRDVFFCYCQELGMISLHSSSIIYEGKAYLFSAPSGTGKSTHTNLWEEYCGVKPLNGDVALLSVEGGTVYAHGIPWCGTSEKYSNVTVPLGNIVFLKRGPANEIGMMNPFEAVLNICSRSFSPNWNKSLTEKTLNVAKEIENLSPCLLLKCLPDKGAMETVKEYIDKKRV